MRLARRDFIKTAGATGLALAAAPAMASGRSRINRQALVRRHNPVARGFAPFSALTVGNGEFAYTADITGLQTFTARCDKLFPLCTTAHWSWHTTSAPAGIRREDLRYRDFDTYGRAVGYATDRAGQEPLFDWLRENPHRLHLGRLGLELVKLDGALASPEDLNNCRQVRVLGEVNSCPNLLPSRHGSAGGVHRISLDRFGCPARSSGFSMRFARNEHGGLGRAGAAYNQADPPERPACRLRAEIG